MVYIVGIGPGSREYILLKALKVLNSSELVIGFGRALESLGEIDAEKVKAGSLNEILEYIEKNREKAIAVAASGDPCFYGITDFIKRSFDGDIEIIPGISSFQYLAAKLGMTWQGAYLGSLHGRECDFLQGVSENRLSIWLTDRNNPPHSLCRRLCEGKVCARVHIGENLSYEDERITCGLPGELLGQSFGELSVVVVERQGEAYEVFKG